MSLDYLKVKILSLTEEAKIIRRMETKRKQQAAYARDMYHVERRIAFHEKEMTRLEYAFNKNEFDLDTDYDEMDARCQWHELEIKRLQRQANKKIEPTEITDAETVYTGLHLHRVNEVRKEARSAYLAYGFLRGLAYWEMEECAYTQPNWVRIKVLALKYGGKTNDELPALDVRFEEWKKEAVKSTYVNEKHVGQPRSRRGQAFWNLLHKLFLPTEAA